MNAIYYAGIGSRETPQNILNLMFQLGSVLAQRNWILRSGGAPGADRAFEQGADISTGKKEIFIPWNGFNKSSSNLYELSLTSKAYEIASKIHPAWHNCSVSARKFLARNVFQIAGQDLKSPSAIAIGWTKKRGGTQFTFNVANFFKVPVVNLFNERFYDINDVLGLIDFHIYGQERY